MPDAVRTSASDSVIELLESSEMMGTIQTLTRRDVLRGLSMGAVALASGGLMTGCGGSGGGGNSSSSGFYPDLTRFTPNYANVVTLDYWPSLPLTVYFANDLTVTPQGGALTHVNDVIQSGFDEWGAATGGVIGYRVVTDPSAANIMVTSEVIPRPTGNAETGDTSLNAPNNVIVSATTAVYFWTDITVAELTVGQRTTSAHEFGHLIGIAGHSTEPSDLMYASHTPTQDVQPSLRDVNTVKTVCIVSGDNVQWEARGRETE
jgi:hypothetical protein